MTIRLTAAPGMKRRIPWEEWAEKRPYLSSKQRSVYLYLREKAVRGEPLDLKGMGRDLGLDAARTLWESKGALTIAAIRTVIEQLESMGLVTFASDEERQNVVGKAGW